jgi:6-phosphogluconolactonase
MEKDAQHFVYIGTYAATDKPAIYVYTLDSKTGQLTFVESVTGIANPSFLALDESRHRLYAVSETQTFQAQTGGSVDAFTIEPARGTLTHINQQPTHGTDPCYLSIDATGTCLLVVNYTSGSISVFPVQANGEIAEANQVIQHHGRSIRDDRQASPHTHTIVLDASGQYALVTDLGMDKIFSYKLDTQAHKLILQHETEDTPGSGPRHIAFHPSERYVYVIHELNSTITAFAYDASRASLSPLQTVSTLPSDFAGDNLGAEIAILPSGKFLYGSNRGDNSIVVFSIDPETGLLTYSQHVSTFGKTPRNFTITPDERFLFAANQDSDTVITYTIDQDTGQLEPTGQTLHIPAPVCIKITHL